MTDRRLRDAERAYRLSGSTADEAAWLRERLRAGTLSQERLELAAYCGHEAGWLAAGRPWFGAQGERRGDDMGGPWDQCRGTIAPLGLATWVGGLSRWGPWVLRRASVAAARLALAPWCDSTRMSGRTGMHAERNEREGRCTRCTPRERLLHRPGNCLDAAQGVLSGSRDDYETEGVWDMAWTQNTRACPWLPAPIAAADVRAIEIRASASLAGEQPVREAIQRALTQWALS